jgi:Fe-S-cluster containining protein
MNHHQQINGTANGLALMPALADYKANGVASHPTPPEAPPEDTSLEELRDQVAEGLMFSHSRENANTSKILEVASFSYALIELLMERGLISVEELDARKREVGERLVEKYMEKGMGVALTKNEEDKYAYQSEVEIDCASRIHLCRQACCRLRFALSVQDLEEGAVKWELGQPYMIRHDADGYCHHVDRQRARCAIYEQRPIVCRAYDCRQDKRIWADFENRSVSSELGKLFQQASPDNGSEAANAASAPNNLVQITPRPQVAAPM